MQSDRPVQTDADPTGARPLASAYPAQPTTGPEVEHGAPEEHIHLPPASVWPITMAGSLTLAGLGTVTTWPITFLGGLLAVIAIVSWIQELRHEQHH